ncbi:MAG: lipoprotein [Pseudomonadota bacterium]
MHCTFRRLLLIMLLIATAQLAACGQKGPLYMPDEKQQSEEIEPKG